MHDENLDDIQVSLNIHIQGGWQAEPYNVDVCQVV